MHTVTSFHSSAVQPEQLSGIMSEYLALERARIFRRLLVKRFGVLAVIIAGVSFSLLSVAASWFSVGLCVVAPLWSWIVERRCERRLVHRLDGVPGLSVRKS